MRLFCDTSVSQSRVWSVSASKMAGVRCCLFARPCCTRRPLEKLDNPEQCGPTARMALPFRKPFFVLGFFKIRLCVDNFSLITCEVSWLVHLQFGRVEDDDPTPQNHERLVHLAFL